MVTKIAGIYAERLMSDVLLVVGDQSLPAHRLILCASSEVFQVPAPIHVHPTVLREFFYRPDGFESA